MCPLPVISPPTTEIPRCCEPPGGAAPAPTKFHFAINVSDIDRSVAFYARLFGVPPAKHHHDYAKFELDQPPLVFSLVPNPPGSQGALRSLGLPVAATADVEATLQRLREGGFHSGASGGAGPSPGAGLPPGGETNVPANCGRVCVADPDQNRWEIYLSLPDNMLPDKTALRGAGPAEPRDDRAADSPAGLAPTLSSTERNSWPESGQRAAVVWEHRVTEELPPRIPFDDGVVDEVRLVGTFNGELDRDQRSCLLKDALRVLKPGGEVKAHGLVASQALGDEFPALPGIAALVQRVLTESEPLEELARAGFIHVLVTKLNAAPVFTQGAVEMREVKASGRKPIATATPSNEPPIGPQRTLVYAGPFAEVIDDAGQRYPRGGRVVISLAQWAALSTSAAAPHFLLLNETPSQSEH